MTGKGSVKCQIRAMAIVVVVLMLLGALPMTAVANIRSSGNVSNVSDDRGTTEISVMGGKVLPLAGYPGLVNRTDENTPTLLNSARKLVTDANGMLHAVWRNNNGNILYTNSTDNGQTWNQTPTILSSAMTGCDNPSIAVNNTSLFVVWDNGWNSLYYRKFNGTDWLPNLGVGAQQIHNGGGGGNPNAIRPSIAHNGSGGVVVAFELDNFGNDNIYIKVSTTDGDPVSFSANRQVTADNDDYRPSVSFESDGDIVLAYTRFGGGGSQNVYFRRSTDLGVTAPWPAATNLNNLDNVGLHTSLATSGSNVSVSWTQGGNAEIFFRNSTDDGVTWTPAIASPAFNVSNNSGNSEYSSVMVWGNNTVVAWEDNSDAPNRYIAVRFFIDGVWEDQRNISYSSSPERYPNLDLKMTNECAGLVYTRNNATAFDLNYTRICLTYPTLNWVGSTGYSSDGLEPEGNHTALTYIYKVTYTDPLNKAPLTGFPEVWIDRNIDGDFFDINEKSVMSEVNAADTTYTDGKEYQYNTTFTNIGLYSYTFRAINSDYSTALGSPTALMSGPNIIVIQHPPKLIWAESLGFELDGLNPEVGWANVTNFTYMIRYFDPENDAPATDFPKVMLDMDNNGNFTDTTDKNFTMLPASPTDTSYIDGKIYYYNVTFDTIGTFGYKFVAEDIFNLANETLPKVGPVVTVANRAPTLTWTGETGYANKGVAPDTGTTTTDFVYRVTYTDLDNDTSVGGVKVWVDLNLDNVRDATEWNVMTAADLLDTNLTDGKVYTYNTTLPAVGTYHYAFKAADLLSDATGPATASMDGPIITAVNHIPTLTWVGVAPFDTRGVDPETGETNITTFTYRVVYTDADNDTPKADNPMVGIDVDLNGTIEAGEWFTMVQEDITDTDFTDGVIFGYTYKFVGNPGTSSYQMKVLDAKDTPAMTPGMPGPVLTFSPPNAAPLLEWSGITGMTTEGVEPNEGTTSTTFIYTVKYTDADGDQPAASYPAVFIDMDLNGILTTDEKYSMTDKDTSDTDVTDGKVYEFSMILGKVGEYKYRFAATDTRTLVATGLPTSIMNGPSISVANNAPTLAWTGIGPFASSGLDPATGGPATEFTYKVIYSDPDNDAPATGEPKVIIDLDLDGTLDQILESRIMSPEDAIDTNYVDGKVYVYKVVLGTIGTYKYSFLASDALGNLATGDPLTAMPGPVITQLGGNTKPWLAAIGSGAYAMDGIDPETGTKKTSFVFKIVYWDPDMVDIPAAGYPKLFLAGPANKEYTMTPADANDKDPTNGITYTVSVTGEDLGIGNWQYRFEAKNTFNDTAKLGPFDGPFINEEKEDDGGTTTSTIGGNMFMLFLILAIILLIVGLVIGMLVGRKGKKEEEPERFRKTAAVEDTQRGGYEEHDEQKEEEEAPAVDEEAEEEEGPADAEKEEESKDDSDGDGQEGGDKEEAKEEDDGGDDGPSEETGEEIGGEDK